MGTGVAFQAWDLLVKDANASDSVTDLLHLAVHAAGKQIGWTGNHNLGVGHFFSGLTIRDGDHLSFRGQIYLGDALIEDECTSSDGALS